MKDRLTKEGIPFQSVNQPLGTATLEDVAEGREGSSPITDLILKHIDSRLKDQGTHTDKDGDTVVVYGFRTDATSEIQDQAVTQVLELLRGRVDPFGVSSRSSSARRRSRIVVELPIEDPQGGRSTTSSARRASSSTSSTRFVSRARRRRSDDRVPQGSGA